MTILTRMTTRKHMDTSTRKRMLTPLRMTMLTQLRRLPRVRRHMTITKRTARRMGMDMIIPMHTRTHTHEQP